MHGALKRVATHLALETLRWLESDSEGGDDLGDSYYALGDGGSSGSRELSGTGDDQASGHHSVDVGVFAMGDALRFLRFPILWSFLICVAMTIFFEHWLPVLEGWCCGE